MQMLLTDVDGLHWFDLFHIHPCYVGRLGTARETASCSLKLKSGFSLCVATGTDRNNHFHLSPQMPPYTYAKNIQKLSWNIQKGFKRPRTALQPEQHDPFALTGLQPYTQLFWLALAGETSLWFEWAEEVNQIHNGKNPEPPNQNTGIYNVYVKLTLTINFNWQNPWLVLFLVLVLIPVHLQRQRVASELDWVMPCAKYPLQWEWL